MLHLLKKKNRSQALITVLAYKPPDFSQPLINGSRLNVSILFLLRMYTSRLQNVHIYPLGAGAKMTFFNAPHFAIEMN